MTFDIIKITTKIIDIFLNCRNNMNIVISKVRTIS